MYISSLTIPEILQKDHPAMMAAGMTLGIYTDFPRKKRAEMSALRTLRHIKKEMRSLHLHIYQFRLSAIFPGSNDTHFQDRHPGEIRQQVVTAWIISDL
jgi:hypothetical protein